MAWLPDFYPIASGGFGTKCGACLASAFTVAKEREEAWAELQRAGWAPYESKLGTGGRTYPICPACVKDPPDVDKAVARAHKSRQRK